MILKNTKSGEELAWHEKKKLIAVLLVMCVGVLAMVSTNGIDVEKLPSVTMTLQENPKYVKGKDSSARYELSSDKGRFTISGLNYESMDRYYFEVNVAKYSIVTVRVRGNEIYALTYNGIPLLDYEAISKMRLYESIFTAILLSPTILACMVLLLVRHPIRSVAYDTAHFLGVIFLMSLGFAATFLFLT